MRTICTAIPLAGFLVFAALVPSRAETLSCATVNGETFCSRGGQSLSCTTVNGRTTCLSGPGSLSCRSVDGDTVCRAVPEPDEEDDEQEILEDPAPTALPLPGASDVEIRSDASGLRVRAGGVVVEMD